MSVRNIAMRAYQEALAKQKIGPSVNTAQTMGQKKAQAFSDTIGKSIKQVNEMQEEKHAMIESFASGETQNVHELMISLQKAGLAMKMTSAVRNKVMEAYRELSKIAF